MARRHPMSCKVCGARAPWVSISATGLCRAHGVMRLTENIHGMVTRSGPAFRRWREAMARSVGGELLDARRDET